MGSDAVLIKRVVFLCNKMKKKFRIDTLLLGLMHNTAIEEGLDPYKLVATYAILKTSRNGNIKYRSYTSKNNKKVSGYGLLRKETGLSLHTLKKYTPVLIALKLASFDDNGDFILLGNRKTKQLTEKRTNKLAPITIGKNLTETRYSVMKIFLHSKQKRIHFCKDRKHTRREIIKGNPKNKKESSLYKKMIKNPNKYGLDNYNDNCVLSNMGYSKLLFDEEDNKQLGSYYKSIFRERGLIRSNRQFKSVRSMSRGEYLRTVDRKKSPKMSWRRGELVEELVATFEVPENHFNRKKRIKRSKTIRVTEKKDSFESSLGKAVDSSSNYRKREDLSFDFIGWCYDTPIMSETERKAHLYKQQTTLVKDFYSEDK